MAEQDFLEHQLERPDTRSRFNRAVEGVGACLGLLALFAGLLAGLQTPDARGIFGLGAAIAAFTAIRIRKPQIIESLLCFLERNRGVLKKGIAVLLVLFPFCSLNDPYLIHIVAFAAIYAVMALGLNLTLGYAGLFDLGFAVYFGVGAYVAAQASLLTAWPFFVILPLSGVVAMMVGALIALPAVRLREQYLGMITLGFVLATTLIARNVTLLTGGNEGLLGIPMPSVLGHSFGKNVTLGSLTLPFQIHFYYLNVFCAAAAFFFARKIKKSRFGRSLEALREDETAAQCCGLFAWRLKVTVFAIGAFWGGLGGGLFAPMMTFVNPDNFTFSVSIMLFAMVLIGGAGNPAGVAAGAALLALLPERFRAFEHLRLMLFGVAILLVMHFRPQGLFPTRRHRHTVKPHHMQELLDRVRKP